MHLVEEAVACPKAQLPKNSALQEDRTAAHRPVFSVPEGQEWA